MKIGKVVAAATLVGALCLVIVACGDQSSSPVSPGSATARISAVEVPPPPPEEICDDGKDNDGDGQVDEGCQPPPPPGPGCSPGYWKNHESHFEDVCTAAAALTGDAFNSCGDLWTAITCKGNQPDCTGPRRQAAAAALNTVSRCTE